MTLVALALWLPASNHCRLEVLPGFEFLVCCCSEETAPTQDSDCPPDACGVVEYGLYKSEDGQETLIQPDSISAGCPLARAETALALRPAGRVISGEAPPEWQASWRFSVRAAGEPRAPSFAS
jgi:hypothetical protein